MRGRNTFRVKPAGPYLLAQAPGSSTIDASVNGIGLLPNKSNRREFAASGESKSAGSDIIVNGTTSSFHAGKVFAMSQATKIPPCCPLGPKALYSTALY